jgi:hypothetical protein
MKSHNQNQFTRAGGASRPTWVALALVTLSTFNSQLSTARAQGLSAAPLSAKIVLRPAPWQDGEEMQLDVKRAGVKVGSYRYSVTAGQTNGQKIWRLVDNLPGGPRVQGEVQADTFKPLQSSAKFGEKFVDTTYRLDHAEVKSSAEAEVRNVALDGPVFDNEEFFQLVRRLPLAPGYRIRLPLLPSGRSVTIWELEVSGLETVTVPAGTYECFKLKPFAGQTYWYSTDPHRYLVKWEVGSAAAELSAVRHSTEKSPPTEPAARP